MARHHAFLAAALLSLPLPAAAGVQVLGTTTARACYQAAESDLAPTRAGFQNCNAALRDNSMPQGDIVATYVNRGILFLKSGNIDAALADFDRATALDPDQPEAYLNRGSAMLKRAQAQPAVGMFDTALAKQTTRPELAHYARGVAHEELGNLRAAYQDYLRASELAPRWREPKLELQRFRVIPR